MVKIYLEPNSKYQIPSIPVIHNEELYKLLRTRKEPIREYKPLIEYGDLFKTYIILTNDEKKQMYEYEYKYEYIHKSIIIYDNDITSFKNVIIDPIIKEDIKEMIFTFPKDGFISNCKLVMTYEKDNEWTHWQNYDFMYNLLWSSVEWKCNDLALNRTRLENILNWNFANNIKGNEGTNFIEIPLYNLLTIGSTELFCMEPVKDYDMSINITLKPLIDIKNVKLQLSVDYYTTKPECEFPKKIKEISNIEIRPIIKDIIQKRQGKNKTHIKLLQKLEDKSF
jgi:hypothetical protein